MTGAELLLQNVEVPTELMLPPRGFASSRSQAWSPASAFTILPLVTIKNHSPPTVSLKKLHNKDKTQTFKSFHFPVSTFMGDQASTWLLSHEQAFGAQSFRKACSHTCRRLEMLIKWHYTAVIDKCVFTGPSVSARTVLSCATFALC